MGIAAALLFLAIAFTAFLGAVDRGLLDGVFARIASARFHRHIAFDQLKSHLLSGEPNITVRGLVIDNPPRLRGGHLAEAAWLWIGLDPKALWRGSFRLRSIATRGLSLHLVRYGPMDNNWTFTTTPGIGPAFAPLASVDKLSITNSHIDVHDYGRRLVLGGDLSHDATGALPFHFGGSGTLAGFPIAAVINGGQFYGPAVGQPWPLNAHIVDGGTVVDAHGTSGDAFNLSTFDLQIAASGPNLADLGYLFQFMVPNSAPYRLRAHGQSNSVLFNFTDVAGKVGQSDVKGWIRSDHSQARRQIRAGFASTVLHRADIEALLAPIPSRQQARSGSGAVLVAGTGRWLLPDAPFGVERMRTADFDFDIRAGAIGGFALPLQDVATKVTLREGVLRFSNFKGDLYGGDLIGSASLDARGNLPKLTMKGRLNNARLGATPVGSALGPAARFDMRVDVRGPGRSVHDAAGRAYGRIEMRLKDAAIPRRAAWIMGGDLLRALGSSDKAGASAPITCAAIDLSGAGGPFLVSGFKIETPLGFAGGAGSIDFGQETMRLLMQGHPLEKRLFQVSTPLLLAGPLMKPVLTVLPADHARKLGLQGKLGIALSPIVGLLPMGHDKLPAASTNVRCR